MKIMLINPNSQTMQSHWAFKKFISPIPPINLAYIASVLEKRGNKVIIVDQVARGINNEALLNSVRQSHPEVIGFSCLTPVINNVSLLVDKIRLFDKKIKIVLGNVHATLFADELLRGNIADIIVRGEGEVSMSEVVSAIGANEDLTSIQGISFRDNGSTVHNSERELIENMDSLPYPAWHLIDLRDYDSTPLASVYEVILPMQASRGCPFRCIFCSQDKIYKKPRYRKVRDVVDELEFMHLKYKVRYFGFFDPSFPFSIKQGLEFCEELMHRDLYRKIKWTTETRVDLVNQELLNKMKEAGCHLIMYGFEVGNQKILENLKKKTDLSQAKTAMKLTKKAGINTLGLFMLGMPGETKLTCEETISFAKELDCDIAKFNLAVPYPGSELFEDYKVKVGEKQEDWEKFIGWNDWSGLGPLYIPDGMNAQELVHLQRKAMFQFYVRPKIILRHIIKGTISFENLMCGGYILVRKYFDSLLNQARDIFKKWMNQKN